MIWLVGGIFVLGFIGSVCFGLALTKQDERRWKLMENSGSDLVVWFGRQYSYGPRDPYIWHDTSEFD